MSAHGQGGGGWNVGPTLAFLVAFCVLIVCATAVEIAKVFAA